MKFKTTLGPFLKDFRTPEGYISDIHKRELIDEIPAKKGAYIIISDQQKFIYPNGRSRVIYIGTSGNLRQRLTKHHRICTMIGELTRTERKQDWYYSRYQYTASFGGKVYWFTTRGSQLEKNLEEKLLALFYERYHALPVGNGAFSFGK